MREPGGCAETGLAAFSFGERPRGRGWALLGFHLMFLSDTLAGPRHSRRA